MSTHRTVLSGMSILFAAAALTASPIHAADQAGTRPLKDKDVTIAIERSLQKDGLIPYDMIDVRTQEGVVTLTGMVKNLLAKEQALQHAATIKGVRSIVNRIEVKPNPRPDEDVAKDVSRALLVDPATDSYEIKTATANGTVTLTGTVHSWAEKDLAGKVVKGVKGVKAVNNHLDVRFKESRVDSEIEAEIERRVHYDAWINDRDIRIEVKDGTVTLMGTVGSALEKSRTAYDSWVAGVRGVDDSRLEVAWQDRHDLRRTKYADKSDKEIKKAVEDAFIYDPRVLSFKPEMDVNAGVVMLTGIVDNLKAKQAAEETARNTVGVHGVQNYLKVRPVNPPDDAALQRNIRAALVWDPFVDRFDLNVTVHNGVAYLTGTVDSYHEKWRAEDIASRVNGVVHVNNRLSVGYAWTWKKDWEIKQGVESELFWSPFVDADEVVVSVKDGVVTLTGTVDSWIEKNTASGNAIEGGAKSVRNLLAVGED